MNEDKLFRLIFWALLVLFLITNRILPILVAKRRNEKIFPNKGAIRNEGLTSFLARVVLGLIFGGFLILYALYPPYMNVLQIKIPEFLRWIGVVLACLGQFAWAYSQAMLTRYWSPNLQLKRIIK